MTDDVISGVPPTWPGGHVAQVAGPDRNGEFEIALNPDPSFPFANYIADVWGGENFIGDPGLNVYRRPLPGGAAFVRKAGAFTPPGDENGDWQITQSDLIGSPGSFRDHLGLTIPAGDPDTEMLSIHDANGDRTVDMSDFAIIMQGFSGAQIDCDGNGTGDLAAVVTESDLLNVKVMRASLPGSGAAGFEKVRVLTVRGGNPGRLTAIRVGSGGGFRWVGPPTTMCENSGQTVPVGGACGVAPGLASDRFMTSRLQCDPFYADWSGLGEVYVTGSFIVPARDYTIQEIAQGCVTTLESNFSSALVVSTSNWGDAVRDCTTRPCGAPDGTVGVTTDVTAVLDKFKNLEGSIRKARADIEPGTLDYKINISDVTSALDAFGSQPYPFPIEPCN